MKKVDRSELLDLGAYEQIRPHFRGRMIEQKRKRRIELGENLSIIFENHDSVLLQVQEMLRTERITDETAIAHELSTYNDLIPEPGNLSATLFIEYTDAAERKEMLVRLASLRTGVHLVIGTQKSTARFVTQPGEEIDRLPAVNFLIFKPGQAVAGALRDSATRVAFEVEHAAGRIVQELTPDMRAELAADLA